LTRIAARISPAIWPTAKKSAKAATIEEKYQYLFFTGPANSN